VIAIVSPQKTDRKKLWQRSPPKPHPQPLTISLKPFHNLSHVIAADLFQQGVGDDGGYDGFGDDSGGGDSTGCLLYTSDAADE